MTGPIEKELAERTAIISVALARKLIFVDSDVIEAVLREAYALDRGALNREAVEQHVAEMREGPFLEEAPTADGPIPSGMHRLAAMAADADQYIDLVGGEQSRAWAEIYKLPGMLPEHVLRQIATPIVGRRRVVTTMTPGLAAALLDRYAASRRVDMAHVERIADQLNAPSRDDGPFEEVHVAGNGRTVAGQHLLHAVVRTRRPAYGVIVVIGAGLPDGPAGR